MKKRQRQDETPDLADAEPLSEAPKPFNLFAGIEPEPLQSGEPVPNPNPHLAKKPETPSASCSSELQSRDEHPRFWLYVAIGIAALVVGILIGIKLSH